MLKLHLFKNMKEIYYLNLKFIYQNNTELSKMSDILNFILGIYYFTFDKKEKIFIFCLNKQIIEKVKPKKKCFT
jgi:hypothetical protein